MDFRLTRRAAALLIAGGGASLIAPPRWLRAEDLAAAGEALAEEAAGGPPEGWIRAHGSTLFGELLYPPDFKHLNFVNPEAPKGGRVRMGGFGTFDSFHPFITRGSSAAGLGLLFESLMSSPYDEQSAQYGLLAEWMEYPADFSAVSFKIRDEARWADGRPVTPADVVFSFEALTTKGLPFYRAYYEHVEKAEDLGGGVVRFTFDQADNRELPQIMGQLTILPKHWWEVEGRDFTRSGFEKPMGSGAYALGAFEAGRFVEYDRRKDYWGEKLPLNLGQNNFDVVRYEYFLDDGAAFEAFKTGQIEYRAENSANNWATLYDFPALRRGDVIKREIVMDGPKNVQTFTMNMRRPQFQDRRVRQAIALAFDFDWANQTIFHRQYDRPWSYFQGVKELRAEGLPDEAELAILEPYRGQIPDEVFTQPFRYPRTLKGSEAEISAELDELQSSDRDVAKAGLEKLAKRDLDPAKARLSLQKARDLLKAAGWETRNGKLVDAAGQPFKIEFLFRQSNLERILNPFMASLRRLGIEGGLRFIDGPQYVNRVQEMDFDMVVGGVANSESPGNEQRDLWGSAGADLPGTRNLGGVKNPVVDALIERVVFATGREDLEAATRALDRVLLHEHYQVLQLYTPFERIAYWKRLQPPEPLPPYSVGFPSIWWSGS